MYLSVVFFMEGETMSPYSLMISLKTICLTKVIYIRGIIAISSAYRMFLNLFSRYASLSNRASLPPT